MNLKYDKITEAIIGSAFEVYNDLVVIVMNPTMRDDEAISRLFLSTTWEQGDE